MPRYRILIAAASVIAVVACADRSSRPDAVSAIATTTAGVDSAMAVCDSIAAEWKQRDTTASVRTVADTLISEQEDPFVYPNAPEHRACLTVVRVEHYHADAPPTLHGAQAVPTWRTGWTPIDSMIADGPDGGEQGYMRRAVTCVARMDVDGDDDADSTHVRADWRVETTMCWRSRQPASQ